MKNPFKSLRISRRALAVNAVGLAAISSIPWFWRQYYSKNPVVNIHRPGMNIGHALRFNKSLAIPEETWHCDVVIAGSGGAAMAAAWKLKREGFERFVMLEGPEPDGNNAGMSYEELSFPTAAHYFALPSKESAHVREMLADINVLKSDPHAAAPEYDEMVLIHALEERLMKQGTWQEGLLPKEDEDSQRFFKLVEQLAHEQGEDGKPIFAMPIVYSSQKNRWLKLDDMTFAQWLAEEGYHSESLLWYLNYCCRDDYGQGIQYVSAWAGLHYFASRMGMAKNADQSAVLTWPDGLASFNRLIREYVGFQRQAAIGFKGTIETPTVMSGTVLRATEHPDHVELLVAALDESPASAGSLKTVTIIAKKMISAMPLYAAAKVVTNIKSYGFDPDKHMPAYGPWIISNFIFNTFPEEKSGAPLAWDNVVLEGPALGYVVSTHQWIRAAKPAKTAFTTYYPLDEESPESIRQWMMSASQDELLKKAAADLQLAYPKDLWRYVEQVDISLRGHAMASPTPGYRSNSGLQALQKNDHRILFAHSDLSGYSVIEEATWWGVQAAMKILNS